MDTFKHIQFEKKDGFAYLFLNRPEVHNAIDPIMISELALILSRIEQDKELRAIVISGRGKSFSSGADLNYMKSLVNLSKRENLEDAGHLAALFDVIYNCPLPVISIAHGNVSGGANGIIAASDIAICGDNTTFRFSELKLGLVPATISPYIIRRIGESLAAELMFTSRSFSGLQAFDFGLVNKSVPEDKMESTLQSLLEEMRS